MLLLAAYSFADTPDLTSPPNPDNPDTLSPEPADPQAGKILSSNLERPNVEIVPTPRITTTSFWDQMAKGIAIPSLEMPAVNDLTLLYVNNPDFLVRSLQRAAPYIQEIVDELNQRGMPTDLALLPVIESGFDPRALSPASAAGIWQFIPETGRRYGLQQDWLHDERRDPLAATSAALDYLQKLYSQFGSWHLALAAYNCGENNVANALEKSLAAGRGRDFASVSPFLPMETRNYVPRFIAIRNVFQQFISKSAFLPDIDSHARITGIHINHDVDLHSLARLAAIDYNLLTTINAGALRQVVPANGNVIWIPKNALTKLQSVISVSPEGNSLPVLMDLKPIKAEAGIHLSSLAEKHHMTIDELRAINGIHPSLSVVSSGTLFVKKQADEPIFEGFLSTLSPLKMVGEQALIARMRLASNSDIFLAARPKLIGNSGWIPGRLSLQRGKYKRRHV